MRKKKKPVTKGVTDLPLELNSQKDAKEENIPSVAGGQLKLYASDADNPKRLIELLKERMTRHLASSMVGCVIMS
jgi:hypothetical protein